MNSFASIFISLILTCPVHATIYQWFDWDNDGSLWLSDAEVEPYTDLSGQLLWWADLADASLRHSYFIDSNLEYSTLARARLSQADFTNANLRGVNFSDADLTYVNLQGASLEFANVKGANLFHADLSDTNLTNLRNWENAMWLASTYNDNTIFPEGMNPEDLAMFYVELPAPATALVFLSLGIFSPRRKNQSY